MIFSSIASNIHLKVQENLARDKRPSILNIMRSLVFEKFDKLSGLQI
ncbi:hypothetical protein T11_11613 [Trichinella zimbabwensis]|uniref:Uncharacterized protein n=1 Tax=Trichinella zimbabwensis TaxID=268475 RepID=A0A0V1GIT8_9BILA|nr:hypothetical protein T11_11613 [Trichinella zimbabwensis]